MAFLTDTFTDTEATALTSHTGELGGTWTKHGSAGTNTISVRSNRARFDQSSSSATLYYASGVPASAEYDVEADFYVAGMASQTPLSGICGRLSTSANTMYVVRYNGTSLVWELMNAVAGSFTSLGTFAQTLTDLQSYHVKLEIRDATKKVFIDGVERISSADNTVTATGRVGLRMANTGTVGGGIMFDNLSASDPAGVGGGGGQRNRILLGVG